MGKNITLWCDGMISMATNKKRKCPYAGDDEEIPEIKEGNKGYNQGGSSGRTFRGIKS